MDVENLNFLKGLRRKVKIRDKRSLKKSANKFKLQEGDYPPMTNKEILLGTNDYRDMFLTKFLDSRIEKGVSTITERLSVRGNHKRAAAYLRTSFKDNLIFSSGSERYVIILQDSIVEIDVNSNILEFKLHGTFDVIDKLKDDIKKEFEEINCYINWIYDSHMSTATVPIDSTLMPIEEMYPWLNGESLESYYQRYMESSASIMILYGPPGTGKTSFIRGLLSSTESSANVTYDEAILSKDSLFSDFIEGSSNVLVIEDADLFLSSRKDGNVMMHRFLNVGDGLVTVKGKKIIFSTNLPNIKDIDEALLRPGRCFSVVNFRELTTSESKKLAAKIKVEYNFTDDKETYSISEIFSGTRNSDNKKIKKGFGFC